MVAAFADLMTQDRGKGRLLRVDPFDEPAPRDITFATVPESTRLIRATLCELMIMD